MPCRRMEKCKKICDLYIIFVLTETLKSHNTNAFIHISLFAVFRFYGCCDQFLVKLLYGSKTARLSVRLLETEWGKRDYLGSYKI